MFAWVMFRARDGAFSLVDDLFKMLTIPGVLAVNGVTVKGWFRNESHFLIGADAFGHERIFSKAN